MTRPDRILGLGLVALIVLHGLASLGWPGSFWGASHLAVWPRAVAIACVLLALAGTAWARRLTWRRFGTFPGRRGACVAALAAGVLFWGLHERQHLYGDGSLLIRSRGMSTTFLRGPVLVRSTVVLARGAEDHLGVPIEQTLRLMSVLAGVVAVFLVFRLSHALAHAAASRWLVFCTFGSAGAWQLFFGHVEYYAWLAVPVLAYVLHAVLAWQRRAPVWSTWFSFALLPTLHISTLGLLPAQALLGWRAWRDEPRRRSLVAIPVSVLLALALVRLARSGADTLATHAIGGLRASLAPYFDAGSSRHAFGFLSGPHLWAICNDLILVAPLALVAPVLLWQRAAARPVAQPLLIAAAAGCLLVNVLFNREIGPYRDWDTLAPYAFVLLAWAGTTLAVRCERPHQAAGMIAILALFHVGAWTALNASAAAAERHVRAVLRAAHTWSPYARGYMHEEFAMLARNRGDVPAALQEYRAASQASPGDARYRLGLADMSFRLGDHETAAREYQEALARRPDFVAAHNNLAALLAVTGDLDGARLHALDAVRLDARSFEAWVTLGDIEYQRQAFVAAAAAWEEAERLRPGAPALNERRRRLPR
jgi:tetratricopeptide (TPR) repeat protein